MGPNTLIVGLGTAVSKINHDLRNTLTSAQLLSDQVANLDDPKVQRLAPRLVLSIDAELQVVHLTAELILEAQDHLALFPANLATLRTTYL